MLFYVKSGRGFRLDVLIIGVTFLNGVFLGVWVTEEAARGVRIVEELNGCVGDVGCGGETVEDGGWRYWR